MKTFQLMAVAVIVIFVSSAWAAPRKQKGLAYECKPGAFGEGGAGVDQLFPAFKVVESFEPHFSGAELHTFEAKLLMKDGTQSPVQSICAIAMPDDDIRIQCPLLDAKDFMYAPRARPDIEGLSPSFVNIHLKYQGPPNSPTVQLEDYRFSYFIKYSFEENGVKDSIKFGSNPGLGSLFRKQYTCTATPIF